MNQAKHRVRNIKRIHEYNIKNPGMYEEVFKYAQKNIATLNRLKEVKDISIADQLEVYTSCPTYVAEDIASLLK